jgi:hypothetical protein
MSFMKVNARFPEDLWQIQDKTDRAMYNDQVTRGYDLMSSLSFTVVGLARNIATPLQFNLNRVEEIRNHAKKLKWVIYSNDNDDDTLAVLANNRKPQDKIIYEELKRKFHGSVECSDRYTDMAYYRNKYLEYLGDSDYTIVMDFDIDGFSYDGLAQSIYFMSIQDIDCIGSNSLLYREHEGQVQRLYYDTLAFRRTNRQFGRPHPGEELNLMNFNRGEGLVKVQSCFGGVSLYKTSSLQKYKYMADDCDHVTINRYLSSVYLNPSLITLFGQNPYVLQKEQNV